MPENTLRVVNNSVGSASRKYEDITKVMNFDDALGNFLTAARLGLDANFTWIEGRRIGAQELIAGEHLECLDQDLERQLDAAGLEVKLGKPGELL